MLRLVRVTYTKFWWNEIESLATRNFAINAQFYMYFYKKKSLPIFLRNVKISIWTFLFYKKNVFSKFQRDVISYWVFVRISFLTCFETFKWSFATLVNGKQNLWYLNVKSSIKLNGLWKLYGQFNESSFSWILQNFIRAF